MKILHTADVHLDSPMSFLGPEKAKERKREILSVFLGTLEREIRNGVSVVLLAGDLFDKSRPGKTVKTEILRTIRTYPSVHFYYLRGNHDDANVFAEEGELPPNLFLFSDQWTHYREGNVMISGMELSPESADAVTSLILPEPELFHVVMLHGQDAETKQGGRAETIPLPALRNRSIDYLALGHIHARKEGKLDGRGIYVYPGAFTSRGFDECGEHGYQVLDVSPDGTYTREYCRTEDRICHEVPVDVSGCSGDSEAIERVNTALRDPRYRKEDLLKIVLTGETDPAVSFDTDYLSTNLSHGRYYVRATDRTKTRVDASDYETDPSLLGEFARVVLSKDLPEDVREKILRIGIRALSGEEVTR